MDAIGQEESPVVVALDGSLAVFAGAGQAPASASSAELASLCGRYLAERLGRDLAVLFARQEHTRVIFSFGAEDRLAPGPHLVGRCDGLLTAEPLVALSVRTADCLPIALAGGGVVAMLHAGWRGLALSLLQAAVARFSSEYGVSAEALDAVIGVGVGPCHYQVGEEVTTALARLGGAGDDWLHGNRVALAAWARGRLIAVGMSEERIRVLPGCTACSERYHSHRRDGTAAGRQWSAIVKLPERR